MDKTCFLRHPSSLGFHHSGFKCRVKAGLVYLDLTHPLDPEVEPAYLALAKQID